MGWMQLGAPRFHHVIMRLGKSLKIKIEKSSKINGLAAFKSKLEITIGQGFDAYSAPCGNQWKI